MSGFRFSFPACVIAGKGRIVADDIIILRKHAFPDGIRSSEDVLILFALHKSYPEHSPDWTAYFVESLTAYLVQDTEPTGIIDEAKAGWLMRTIAADGAVRSASELKLLLHAMEVASDVPESLSAFALDQIRLALEPDARGAYHASRPTAEGITVHDLAYIWRVLRSALERGRLMLSPLEARVLHEIDGLAAPSAHHPAWREMIDAILTLDQPQEALRSERWLLADRRLSSEEGLAA